MTETLTAAGSGTFTIGDDLTVTRLGFGAMRIVGPGVWGEPTDHDEVIRVLRRAVVVLGVCGHCCRLSAVQRYTP